MKNHYLSRLDHMRFFASILVIFFHFRQFPIPTYDIYNSSNSFNKILLLWIEYGHEGVSLFLVLSGFIFTYITKGGQKKIVFYKFIINRILRIYPLLFFVFISIICISRKESTPIDILRFIFLQFNTGNQNTGWGGDLLDVGSIWTIAVEFQFYLLFPVLNRYIHDNSYTSLLGIIFLINLFKLVIVLHVGNTTQINIDIYHSLIGRLDQFLIGVIAGCVYVEKEKEMISFFKRHGWPFIIFTLLCMSILHFIKFECFSIYNATFSYLIEAILWMILIFSYMHIPLPLDKHTNMILCDLGNRSYSIYCTSY